MLYRIPIVVLVFAMFGWAFTAIESAYRIYNHFSQ